MSTFSLRRQHAIHEGGTKYYQVIIIQDEKGRAVVCTHWGAHDPRITMAPLHHGQCKIEVMETGGLSVYNTARRNKEKRGYARWTAEPAITFDGKFLRAKINGIFKPKDVDAICKYFEDKTWQSAISEEPTDPEIERLFSGRPSSEPEPEKPAQDHADWGTW